MSTLKSRLSVRWISFISFLSLLVILTVGCEYVEPNKPPYVQKLAPADSAQFTVGQPVEFLVDAYDIDGTVVRVVFTDPAGTEFTDEAAPYQFIWLTDGLSRGLYQIQVKAVDNKGEPYIIKAPVELVSALITYAGLDTTYRDTRTSHPLEAFLPADCQGTWEILSGAGGKISDIHSPIAILTGEPCQTYLLRWTVRNGAREASANVTIGFQYEPSPAFAGDDRFVTDGTSYTGLNATQPLDGQGLWTIVSGGDGSLTDPSNPKARFDGLPCHRYVLRWTVSTACSSVFDEVVIVFNQSDVIAYAGADVRIGDGILTISLTGNNPGQLRTGTWSIISGYGGYIQDPHSHQSLFTGLDGYIYVLKWSISGTCMENYDLIEISFVSSSPLVDERDGKTYHSIRIGDQYWMSENLNYAASGSYAYEYSSVSASIYGRLYDWNSALFACPDGWHLPTDPEWKQLEEFLGVDPSTTETLIYRGTREGGMLKEQGNRRWFNPNTGATNITGFTALPGGNRTPEGLFGGLHAQTAFWTATGNADGTAYYRALNANSSQIGRHLHDKGWGFSIRCVKN